jgi:hypothetical protein
MIESNENFSMSDFTPTIRCNKSFVLSLVAKDGVRSLALLLSSMSIRMVGNRDELNGHEILVQCRQNKYGYCYDDFSTRTVIVDKQRNNSALRINTIPLTGESYGSNIIQAEIMDLGAVEFSLLNNNDFAVELLCICPEVYEFLSENLKQDPSIYYDVLDKSPSMIRHVPISVLTQIEFWKRVLTFWRNMDYFYYSMAIRAIPDIIGSNDELMMTLIEINILVFPLATGSIHSDTGLYNEFKRKLNEVFEKKS